jgi:hypothetical protein
MKRLKLTFAILVIVLEFSSCSINSKTENEPDMKLAAEFGIDSINTTKIWIYGYM